MNETFERFIESQTKRSTIKVIKTISEIGDYDFTNCTQEDVEELILTFKMNSLKNVITVCYIIGLYARFIGDDNLYNITLHIDKNKIWEIVKQNTQYRFLSHEMYMTVYHDIGMYEEMNQLFYQTLFRCLYEGIYNQGITVLKNLRASDIHENCVLLRDDNGNVYNLEISSELAGDLKELGTVHVWERKNRYGYFNIKATGLYPDSCFKLEIRKEGSKYSYTNSYYRILNDKLKEYLGFEVLPLHIYVSGIMHRIELNLKKVGITLEEAFAYNNKDRTVTDIIAKELKRSNYNIEVRAFRQIVRGHIDEFTGIKAVK